MQSPTRYEPLIALYAHNLSVYILNGCDSISKQEFEFIINDSQCLRDYMIRESLQEFIYKEITFYLDKNDLLCYKQN